MNLRQLTLTMCVMYISFSASADSLKAAVQEAKYGVAFGIQLGSKLDRSTLIGSEVLAAGGYRTTRNSDGSFSFLNEANQQEVRNEDRHLPVYHQIKPPSPSSLFTHYYVGITPQSSLIYKIIAINYDEELKELRLKEQESEELQKADEERVIWQKQTKFLTREWHEKERVWANRKNEIIEKYQRDREQMGGECISRHNDLSHVLRKKYGEKSELSSSMASSSPTVYAVGLMRIVLSCKGGRLAISYSDVRLDKQREVEWTKVENRTMDNKTRGIDSSKF